MRKIARAAGGARPACSTSPSTARTAPPLGGELEHAALVAAAGNVDDNRYGRVGARVHDVRPSAFEQRCRHHRRRAPAQRLAYLVLPKVDSVADVERAAAIDRSHAAKPARARPAAARADRDPRRAARRAAPSPRCPSRVACRSASWISSRRTTARFPAARCARRASSSIRWWCAPSSRSSAACHAHGKMPSHNVDTEIRDSACVAIDAAARRGEFGYTRMWSIHPDQIEPIVKAFTPRRGRSRRSSDILSAAQDANWGPTAASRRACTTAPATATTGPCCSAQAGRPRAAAKPLRYRQTPTYPERQRMLPKTFMSKLLRS